MKRVRDSHLFLALVCMVFADVFAGGETVVTENAKLGEWKVADEWVLSGVGGVVADSLRLGEGGRLILDPVRTPVRIGGTLTIGRGAQIALPKKYSDMTCGRIVLLTARTVVFENGASAGTVFSADSIRGRPTVTCEIAPNGSDKQLVLTVGDYVRAPEIVILPIGDSITEGSDSGATYRIPLAKKLAAMGYRPRFRGFLDKINKRPPVDAAGVLQPQEYARHSGVSGMRAITIYDRGGIRDALGNYLEQAGTPDVINFHVGCNDLASWGPEVLFPVVTGCVERILVARPSARVVLATLIDYKPRHEKILVFNEKIRDFVATRKDAPRRLFLVDLFKACPLQGHERNLEDGQHPSFLGHDLTSDAWLAADLEAYKTPSAGRPQLPNGASGAIANVPADYRAGMVHLRTVEISSPTNALSIGGPVPYAFVATGSAESDVLSRVGYYLELKRRDSDNRRFVWVDMKAFGNGTVAAASVPLMNVVEQKTDDLHVYSNDESIKIVPSDRHDVEGWIQFSPYDSEMRPSGLPGAPERLTHGHGWNDFLKKDRICPRGCMQVFRKFRKDEHWNAAQTLFAWNNWSTPIGPNRGADEIGIGDFIEHAHYYAEPSIAYYGTCGRMMDSINANAYEIMHLEIWGCGPVGKKEKGK